jgi:hypothetical protein
MTGGSTKSENISIGFGISFPFTSTIDFESSSSAQRRTRDGSRRARVTFDVVIFVKVDARLLLTKNDLFEWQIARHIELLDFGLQKPDGS